jgi:predicted alpha/beta superfamily hydrolase
MELPRLEWQDYIEYIGERNHTVVGSVRILPEVWSPQLENARSVLVYLPPSYHQSDRRYPVIYMHDGQNLFDRGTGFAGQEWEADETMERLSAEGLEAILVGIYNTPHRMQEYNPFTHLRHGQGETYLAFITDTIKPLIDRDLRTLPDRDHTGIMGSSMGGLISLYAFFHRSDMFGFTGIMSPSAWLGGGAIYAYIRQQSFSPGKIYLDNGTREPSARKLNAMLAEKGYQPGQTLLYVVEEDAEHNEAAWARRLPNALRFLLSSGAG